MTSFRELLSQHAASSLLKQHKLGDLLGQHSWAVDLDLGTVDFGQNRAYAIQMIGTESQVSGTWLWAWANEGSNIPPNLLACAQALREMGTREGIEELAQAQLSLDKIDGHALAMAACGVCGASAYYRGPYDGGAAFFTMTGVPLPSEAPSTVEMVNVMTSAISQFPLDHRAMARSFLSQHGFALEESPSQTVATSASGHAITVNFDEAGRILNMETTASQGNAPTARKPWWKLGD